MNIKTIIYASVLSVAAVALIAAQAVFLPGADSAAPSDELSPAFSFFSSEKAYFDHVRTVSFRGIELKEVTVKAGRNFWLIARDYGINIDTLISANPFWKDLNARSSQTVVVPSVKGVIHFVRDFGQIEKVCALYSADRKDAVVQDLPFLSRFTRVFEKNPAPIAVFVRDVKPASSMMQASMAKSFEARELFRSPLGGRFSSYFGRRIHPIFSTNGFHNGIDIATKTGTPVGAAAGGVVEDAGWMGGYGKAVIINHQNGYKTLYGHLSQITTRPGAKIKPGSLIGRVGSTGWSTGPHLHFTVWNKGQLVNPMQLLW